MKDDCLFCKIIRKEVPGLIIHEDDEFLVFLDAFPDRDGHTLVIPKKHIEDIHKIDNDCLIKLMEMGKKYSKVLMDKLDKKSMTFLMNYGDDQAIKHIHLHLIPEHSKGIKSTPREVIFDKLMKD